MVRTASTGSGPRRQSLRPRPRAVDARRGEASPGRSRACSSRSFPIRCAAGLSVAASGAGRARRRRRGRRRAPDPPRPWLTATPASRSSSDFKIELMRRGPPRRRSAPSSHRPGGRAAPANGEPRMPRTYSPTRSAPAASESERPPEKHGLTPVKQYRPFEESMKPRMFTGPSIPRAATSLSVCATSSGSSNVRPFVETPASVSSRQLGTAPTSTPPRLDERVDGELEPLEPRLDDRARTCGRSPTAAPPDRLRRGRRATTAETRLDDPRAGHAVTAFEVRRRMRDPGAGDDLRKRPLVEARPHRGRIREPRGEAAGGRARPIPPRGPAVPRRRCSRSPARRARPRARTGR